jgi:hypothetical protein
MTPEKFFRLLSSAAIFSAAYTFLVGRLWFSWIIGGDPAFGSEATAWVALFTLIPGALMGLFGAVLLGSFVRTGLGRTAVAVRGCFVGLVVGLIYSIAGLVISRFNVSAQGLFRFSISSVVAGVVGGGLFGLLFGGLYHGIRDQQPLERHLR